jgi:hypothetical protein
VPAPREDGAPVAAPRDEGAPVAAPHEDGGAAPAPRDEGTAGPAPREDGTAAAPREDVTPPTPREDGAPATHGDEPHAGAPRDEGTPSAAPDETAPGAPREDGAPPSAEERAVLENTRAKSAEELTPAEINTERQVAGRTKGRQVDDPPFTTEHDLPNGHKVRETPEGEAGPARRCSRKCAVFDEDGNLVEEVNEDLRNPAAERSPDVAEDIGVQQGREEAATLGLDEAPDWVNVLDRHGFDDVLIDASGNEVVAEYKGGTSDLSPGQMERPWVQGVINRMRARGDVYWANRLQAALDQGRLRGVTFRTPIDPGTGVPGPTTVQWHTY